MQLLFFAILCCSVQEFIFSSVLVWYAWIIQIALDLFHKAPDRITQKISTLLLHKGSRPALHLKGIFYDPRISPSFFTMEDRRKRTNTQHITDYRHHRLLKSDELKCALGSKLEGSLWTTFYCNHRLLQSFAACW